MIMTVLFQIKLSTTFLLLNYYFLLMHDYNVGVQCVVLRGLDPFAPRFRTDPPPLYIIFIFRTSLGLQNLTDDNDNNILS